MRDVKYVSEIKKNLVLAVMLEEKGYDVLFSKGKVFLRHSHGSDQEDRDSSEESL